MDLAKFVQEYALKDGKPYKCENDGCENYVPSKRRIYCSNECGVIASRKKNAQRVERERSLIYRLQKRNKKERTCLKCNKSFMSNGSGNRICIECGKSNAGYGRYGHLTL